VSSGSGLGLSIVRMIAERHGARITLADSEAGGLLVRVGF
jgi:signal transduction histidine kinase